MLVLKNDAKDAPNTPPPVAAAVPRFAESLLTLAISRPFFNIWNSIIYTAFSQ